MFLPVSASYIFTVLYTPTVILSFLVLLGWRFAKFAERQQLWTLRLVLSLWQPYVIAAWALLSSIFLGILTGEAVEIFLEDTESFMATLTANLLFIIFLMLGTDRSMRSLATTQFLKLRWKAWTGPSRTGIPPTLASYVGGVSDWKTLSREFGRAKGHPVERFATVLSQNTDAIECDPTDLLRTTAAAPVPSEPRERSKDGIYQPSTAGMSISLLWGERLGFSRRCSRGIIAVPPNLLVSTPRLKNGIDARSLCLAFGITARNKGLDPKSLICNLRLKDSFRAWEEGGLWPNPSKTLRSYYYTEVDKAFHLLGESFITVVTELAVLLADLDNVLISKWLDLEFEHQDLSLNLEAHSSGASIIDLQRLYRGQYAAMLISLSLFHIGVSVRPEISVFEAVCAADGVALPQWLSTERMKARKEKERHAYGPPLQRMIDAII